MLISSINYDGETGPRERPTVSSETPELPMEPSWVQNYRGTPNKN